MVNDSIDPCRGLATQDFAVVVRHHDYVDRHGLFVSLARPYGHEDPHFAEIYRVPVPFDGGLKVAVAAMAAAVFAVALLTRSYPLANRLVLLPILGLVYAGVMVVRRLQRRPNLVLLAVGDQDLVALRVTFLTGKWKVLDRIGGWPRASVGAERADDVLGLRLTFPGEQPLVLTPLAVSDDAACVLRALVPGQMPCS